MTDRATPLRVLFVCTANICRSPSAEALARHRFGEQAMMFRSAGFLEGGRECPMLLVQSLSELGVDVSLHRSYQLNESSLQAADMVLTMEGEHVQKATLLHKDGFHKILPLKEAADVMDRVRRPEIGLEDFLALANVDRDPSAYLSARWDIDDPYNRKLKDYRRAVTDIAAMVDTVIGPLV